MVLTRADAGARSPHLSQWLHVETRPRLRSRRRPI